MFCGRGLVPLDHLAQVCPAQGPQRGFNSAHFFPQISSKVTNPGNVRSLRVMRGQGQVGGGWAGQEALHRNEHKRSSGRTLLETRCCLRDAGVLAVSVTAHFWWDCVVFDASLIERVCSAPGSPRSLVYICRNVPDKSSCPVRTLIAPGRVLDAPCSFKVSLRNSQGLKSPVQFEMGCQRSGYVGWTYSPPGRWEPRLDARWAVPQDFGGIPVWGLPVSFQLFRIITA